MPDRERRATTLAGRGFQINPFSVIYRVKTSQLPLQSFAACRRKKKRRKGKGSGDTTTCAMMYYVDRNLSLTNVVGGAAAARGNRAKWTRFFFSYYTQHFSSFLRIHCRVFSPALCRSPSAGRNIRNTAETLSLLMNTQKKRVIYRSSSFLYRSTKFGVKRISLHVRRSCTVHYA